jgi:lipopolysaccharide export system permease protein
MVVLYKKFSVPVSASFLTIIAVSVSSICVGGMGMNLTMNCIGISCIFDKIFGVLAEKSSFFH